MSSQTRSLSPLDKLRGIARRGDLRKFAEHAGITAAAVLREVLAMMNAARNLRSDLLRMADECEETRPEQAARLRKVASSSWSE